MSAFNSGVAPYLAHDPRSTFSALLHLRGLPSLCTSLQEVHQHRTRHLDSATTAAMNCALLQNSIMDMLDTTLDTAAVKGIKTKTQLDALVAVLGMYTKVVGTRNRPGATRAPALEAGAGAGAGPSAGSGSGGAGTGTGTGTSSRKTPKRPKDDDGRGTERPHKKR
jgi:hypothetical protein